MERGRGTRSFMALLVAVAAGLVTFYLMGVSDWAPGDPAADSGGQGAVVAIVVALAIALPWLYWVWSRSPGEESERRSARLLRDFDDPARSDRDRY